MREVRAYSKVDEGLARLGNSRLERSWSTFLGHTVELRHKSAAFDWCSGQSPEFSFEADDRPIDRMSFDRAHWSEESNPFGAALSCTRLADTLMLTLHIQAFHASPGMLRRVKLANLGADTLRVRRLRTESLAITAQGVEVLTHNFSRRGTAIAWETEERAAALLRGDHGLLLGIASGGAYDLFDPHAGICSLGPGEDRYIEPREGWALPDTFLLAFDGGIGEAIGRDYGEFLKQVADLKQWEAERAGKD